MSTRADYTWLVKVGLESAAPRRLFTPLLIALLIALPFAEWKFIGLPLNGRSFRVDLNQYLSISLFDIVLCITWLVLLVSYCTRESRFPRMNSLTSVWLVGVTLILLLLYRQQPSIPWLTPITVTVVDARSLILALATAIGVSVLLVDLSLRSIARAFWVFGVTCALAFGVLAILALNEFGYFRVHYPFSNPIAISFPFPNQNVAAPFIGLCLLAVMGGSYYIRCNWVTALAVCSLITSASLTGSRANLLLLSICCVMFLMGILLGMKHDRTEGNQTIAAWLWTFVFGIVSGSALIFLNRDWQPIARSTSIFGDIIGDPAQLLLGGAEGSPRRELWSSAISKASTLRANESPNRKTKGAHDERSSQKSVMRGPNVAESLHGKKEAEHGVALVTVVGGCKVSTEPAFGLTTGLWYSAALDLLKEDGRTLVQLRVKDTQGRQIIKLKQKGTSQNLRAALVLASDSNRRRVIASGEVSNSRIIYGSTIDALTHALMGERGDLAIEQEAHNGGLGNVVSLQTNRVTFNAQTRIFRAAVFGDIHRKATDAVQLEYEFKLSNIDYSLPLDPPVVFYSGLANVRSQEQWHDLSDAVLVQHVRKQRSWEPHQLASQKLEERMSSTRGSINVERLPQLIREWEQADRCGRDGHISISSLWAPTIDAHGLPGRVANLFGGRVGTTTKDVDVSVLPDPSWSVDQHLAQRGSTHNAYLDWYVYEGLLAFMLFAMFVGGYLCLSFRLTWLNRGSAHYPMLLASACQMVLLCGTFYAQPYLWVRYIWVVLGVAGAMALHLGSGVEDNARATGHARA